MTSKRHIPFYFCAVACLSALIFARQPTPEDAKKGAIEGSVINAQSAQPLQSAELTLMRQDLGPLHVYGGGPPPPQTLWQTTTDARGKYEFRDLEPGRYSLSARKTGYGVPEHTDRAAQIHLSADEAATGINFELSPQMTISGRVIDEEGKPVPFAGVAILQERYIDGRKQLYVTSGGAFQASEVGEFRFAGVWNGPIVLQFMPWRLWRATPSGATEGAPDTAYFTTYFPGTLDVSQATQFEFFPGKEHTLEGKLLKTRASRISGSVRDHTGQRPKNCSVILMPTNAPWSGLLSAQVTHAADGSFAIQHVHPGSYRLIVQLDGQGMVHRESITIGPQNIDNVHIRLPSPVAVEGEIVIEAGIELDPREVWPSLHLDEEGLTNIPPPRRITANGHTQFVFEKVLPGKYRIGASLSNAVSQAEGLYIEPIQFGDHEVTDTPVDVTAHPARIRITINRGTGSVIGIVTKNNTPARRATVLLLSADPARRLNQRWVPRTWTDQHAPFAIEHVPPGDYLAFAFDEMETGFWRTEERFKAFARAAQKVSIVRGGSTNVNLEVTPLRNR